MGSMHVVYGTQEENMNDDGCGCVKYCNGVRCWYQNGRLHRVGGPAIENVYGRNEWWENGELIRREEEK